MGRGGSSLSREETKIKTDCFGQPMLDLLMHGCGHQAGCRASWVVAD